MLAPFAESWMKNEKLKGTIFPLGQNREIWFLTEDEKLRGRLFLSGQNRKMWFLTEGKGHYQQC